jgi:hypothetical protein
MPSSNELQNLPRFESASIDSDSNEVQRPQRRVAAQLLTIRGDGRA